MSIQCTQMREPFLCGASLEAGDAELYFLICCGRGCRLHCDPEIFRLLTEPYRPSGLSPVRGPCKKKVFIPLGLALSEKQIPQIVENIGNQKRGSGSTGPRWTPRQLLGLAGDSAAEKILTLDLDYTPTPGSTEPSRSDRQDARSAGRRSYSLRGVSRGVVPHLLSRRAAGRERGRSISVFSFPPGNSRIPWIRDSTLSLDPRKFLPH